MKQTITVVAAALLLAISVSAAPRNTSPAPRQDANMKPQFSGGVLLGYYGGASLQLSGQVENFAHDFPLVARLGVGYAKVEPGIPLAARHTFINDNENGSPTESGSQLDFRFDLMCPVKILGLRQAYLYGGPRYSRFKATFDFVGGNEEFEVYGNQWGLGLGMDSYFTMGRRTDLVLTTGLDNYFDATLTGHGNSYSPNGETVNGREGYTYEDADKSVNQPKVELRLMLGIRYHF